MTKFLSLFGVHSWRKLSRKLLGCVGWIRGSPLWLLNILLNSVISSNYLSWLIFFILLTINISRVVLGLMILKLCTFLGISCYLGPCDGVNFFTPSAVSTIVVLDIMFSNSYINMDIILLFWRIHHVLYSVASSRRSSER